MVIQHTHTPTETRRDSNALPHILDTDPHFLDKIDGAIARLAVRCVDEAVRPVPLPKFAGTPMVLVPRVLFDALENTVRMRCDYERPTQENAPTK